jgi:hypothetical protein
MAGSNVASRDTTHPGSMSDRMPIPACVFHVKHDRRGALVGRLPPVIGSSTGGNREPHSISPKGPAPAAI